MFVNQRENLTLDQESRRALFHTPLQFIPPKPANKPAFCWKFSRQIGGTVYLQEHLEVVDL